MADQINTFSDLQARAGVILGRLNAAPAVAIAAATNPLLAVEHLGYQFNPDTRTGIGDRIRLGPTAAEKLADLRTTIARLVDRQVDPDDGPAVRRLLTDLGVLPCSDGDEPDTDPPRWQPGGAGPDPLEPLRDRHPVLDPLLEYRRISARRPRFAPPRAFAAILSGAVTTPLTAVSGRLQSPDPEPDSHPR
ncbi:hypothetical protein JOD64_004203 [Micromonospora luteifusca]|uniref:Uncharacterized protein n=1 Tax=Micromonospora luteifusca TaxID=709860 RepID=A0ABS2LXS6_9ACTN|nr:hypothetical protein [Micromonospora luteifusca]MBM7492981.1 hypothetical protein [Micromonospora luteifusca]